MHYIDKLEMQREQEKSEERRGDYELLIRTYRKLVDGELLRAEYLERYAQQKLRERETGRS